MAEFNRVEHPVLYVEINGEPTDRRPRSFSLDTVEGLPSATAILHFPSDVKQAEDGDEITVNVQLGDDGYVLSTGVIWRPFQKLARSNVIVTDGYRTLCEKKYLSSYRKEQANVILKDALDAAGITETKITCPNVLLHRFATYSIPVESTITQLIHALKEHGEEGLRFFFDEKNVFHFGTAKDTGQNEGEVFEFETGKNIIEKDEDMIKVLPLPIRHTQKVLVDGETFITKRTSLRIFGKHSFLRLHLREDK